MELNALARCRRAENEIIGLQVALLVLSVGACSGFHGAPKTAPAPPTAAAATEPLFRPHGGAPVNFVASTSDAKTTRTVMVRDELTKQAAFAIASEFLAQHYSVYVRDPNAGFLMTHWESLLVRDGAPELRYRTRIVLSFISDWKQLTVNADANWLHGEEWEWGYDAALLDSVSTQLTSRLGKHT